MPLLENDVIFAYLNENDPKHDLAEKIFHKLQRNEMRVEISSVSLIEMELIYRSEQIEDILLKHLTAITALPNVTYVPITPVMVIASVYLRQTQNMTFFDSHYAATALSSDGKIISFDPAYDDISGLTRIPPESV